MTVGKMRKLMLNKVVPEKIIPQNIVDFLMDENAELAEPDAYTFLTRLRGLGIGSADFIYLLEGCGAPEAAVLKIKSNPAMNLQSLIVAMESGGMTSKDYMRILYTARQIWERTLTSRLEMMEADMLRENAPTEEDDSAQNAIEDPEEQMDEFRSAFEAVTSGKADTPETSERAAAYESPVSAAYDNTTGFSLGETEEFESLLSGNSSENEDTVLPTVEDSLDSEAVIADSNEVIDEYIDEQNTITPASPEDLRKENKIFTVEIDYGADDDDVSETAVRTFETVDNEGGAKDFSESIEESPQTSDEPVSAQPYKGETTAIIKIDREMLEKSLADIARNAGSPEKEEALPKTDEEPVDDGYDEDYDYVRNRSRYHGGALIAASIGAAIVLGSGAAAGVVFGMEPVEPIGYAEDENEIFTAIYYAYNEKIAGGDSYYGYDLQNMTVFGDLLVERDGIGTFTQGSYVYTLTDEEIAVNKLSGGELSSVGTFAPPENTAFADAVQLADGAVIAAFDGDVGGFMKVSGGEALFTVKQDGRLTDFSVTGDEVRLGTVYTPSFYTNFKPVDREVYLPKLGIEYAAMPPQSVIPSETKGYSYGVVGAYSVGNGATLRADAVLGNPVFAAADGVFAVNGAETGMLLRVDYSDAASAAPGTDPVRPKVFTADCGKFSGAAFCENGSAIFENGGIVLRDKELKTLSVLQNLSSIPERMKFSGNTLLVADKEKVFFAANCADLRNPIPTELQRVTGMASGNMAVTLSQTSEGLRAASFTLDETGKSMLVHESIRELTGEQRGTLKFGGAAAIAVSDNVCGAAYSFFDGVSVVSEYVLLGDIPKHVVLYDDKQGFTLAFVPESANGRIYANCGKGLVEIKS